jgi:hypothetical protein
LSGLWELRCWLITASSPPSRRTASTQLTVLQQIDCTQTTDAVVVGCRTRAADKRVAPAGKAESCGWRCEAGNKLRCPAWGNFLVLLGPWPAVVIATWPEVLDYSSAYVELVSPVYRTSRVHYHCLCPLPSSRNRHASRRIFQLSRLRWWLRAVDHGNSRVFCGIASNGFGKEKTSVLLVS